MKFFLHICCAPCLSSALYAMEEKGVSFHGFFYNPNIHPYLEYIQRRDALERLARNLGSEVLFKDSFLQADWEKQEDPQCSFCYEKRLFETARVARERGFTHFSTTLLTSPYQKHDLIRKTAERAEEAYQVAFYFLHSREYYRLGQEKAREMGLYLQKHCGCIHSLRTSKWKDRMSW